MVAGTIQPPPLGVTSLQHSFPSLPLLCSRWPKESVLDQPSSVSYVHHLERVNKTQSLRLRISSSLHAVGKGYSLKGKWSAVRKREWVLGGYKIPMSTPESKVQAHEHWLPKYALFLSLGQHGISSVLSQWWFCPPMPRDIWQCLTTSLVVTTGKKCCWRLVDSSQRWCWQSCSAQDKPPRKDLAQNANSATFEKLWYKDRELR